MRPHVRIRRLRRELATIEGALETGEPRLASMFAIFNWLTKDERPARTEPVPHGVWWRSWLANLMRPVARPCVIFTAAGAPLAVLAGAGPVTGRPAAAGIARRPACPAYPTRK